MGDGFGSDPAEIRNHVANLNNGPFSTLNSAADAASGLTLGGFDAYGVLLQWVIPPALNLCLDDAGAAIRSTSDFAAAIGEALTGVAEDYEGVDQEIADLLSKIGEEIGK
ncbi:hypothetical protein K3N28_14210 [Glycomyces sp. TRM65418]|uniref:hypothetical protein n=1 Tax=Glycomyces sp. TRM65418 TaxID=2867006 RepID=UPI001CE66CE8|nr:hypothetical protein [Glycomyces sp. TRM65418]MCC3764218.1 hypothetical protein [Glycomyces sp. TRM65418]QZD53901.1 hypothetical protein K3N28_14145 [Glycomyces sp. TRM65418]